MIESDDAAKASSAFGQICNILDSLSRRERARVVHSIVDAEAARRPSTGYQLIANFINDRLLVEKGPDKAAEHWRYLASTRTDPRFRNSSLSHANAWAVVRNEGKGKK